MAEISISSKMAAGTYAVCFLKCGITCLKQNPAAHRCTIIVYDTHKVIPSRVQNSCCFLLKPHHYLLLWQKAKITWTRGLMLHNFVNHFP